MKEFLVLTAICFTFILYAGCSSDPVYNETTDNDVSDITYSTERENLDANCSLEVSDSEVYFSFNNGLVEDCGPDSNSWDLKFSGWFIFTNGGISGEHSGGGVYLSGDYEDIGTSSIPGMALKDSYGSVFDNWYDADMEDSFTLSTKGYVYLVKSNDEIYKISILSYYGEVQGTPVSALFTIQYSNMETPDEIITVEGINATAGGSAATGDGAYFSFTAGKMTDMTDEESQESTEWDIRFKRYNIHLNSGESGPGDVRGVKLDTTDYESVDESFIPEDSAFEADRIRPVIDEWAIIDDENKIEFSEYIYLIRTADGNNWFKFYPLEVQDFNEIGYDTINFRYDKVK